MRYKRITQPAPSGSNPEIQQASPRNIIITGKGTHAHGYQCSLLRACCFSTSNASTLAVSIAVTAASKPLLPALPPARSMACRQQ